MSKFCVLFITLCTICQAFLAGVNYSFTGRVSFFQVVIILFIVYAITVGSADIERLDKYIQEIHQRYRQASERVTMQENFSIYIKHRQQLFFVHTIALVFIHFIWFAIDFNTANHLYGYLFYFSDWLQHPDQVFFSNSYLNIISYVWSILYMFDLYFFSLTRFFGGLDKT